MVEKDYSEPDPAILDRVRKATDEELYRYMENAKRKLPTTQWLVAAITQEQVKRGGIINLNANSVREIILKYARSRQTCTYKMIAEELSVSWPQAHWRLPPILDEVSTFERAAGRPLLTAIVTSQKGMCGDGFFEMAMKEGFEVNDKLRFQENEQKRVFEYWGRNEQP
jgi:hypothetical protein